MTDWVVRFLQKEEGQVVPAVSLGGDLAVTPEGQRLRGRLLPNRDPEPGEPLLVTGSPGNYLLDTLSWDPAGVSAYSPVVLDSKRGRCGTCVTLDDLRAGPRERQKWAYFSVRIIIQEEETVELAQFVTEGLRSVKVRTLGRHWLAFGIYGRERCLQRDRQTGFWARGKFAVPFLAPLRAVTRAYIVTGDDNTWFSPGWFQGDPITIPVTEDGRWQVAWQENPRRPSTGITIQSPGASNALNIGTFSLEFEFPFSADLVTLVELEICFGNAGLRRTSG
jgi:hypothetical protein